MQLRHSTAIAVLSAVASLAEARSVNAQGQLANGKFLRMGGGVVAVEDAGSVKTIPIRNTAIISIRGEVDFAEIPKGANVVLQGRVEDKSTVVKDWSVTYYPLSRPFEAVSERTEGSPNRGSYWDLNLFCTVVSTDPFKVRVLPGNEYSMAVYDPVTKFYGLGAYRGPKMDGATISLEAANRSRATTEIEFGANPQYAGAGATVSVTGGGNPIMAETIFIKRVEPFTVPKGPVKKK